MNWRWKLAQAAEIRWWRRYLHGKDPEIYLKQKGDYWRRLLSQLEVDVPPSARVLDAGCGPAGIFMTLPNARVEAIDPLLDEYERDLPHFQPQRYPWVQFRRATIENLALQEVFDCVFCLNVINHVADLEESLQRLYRSGRPGSRLVLSVDVHNYPVFRHLFSWLPGDILHPHQYYLEEYVEMVKQSGWTLERTHRLKSGFFFDYYGIIARKPETT